ncbi:hypothetical protein ERW51_17775 [Aliivibrio finisterrensis]|uniref:hypothetical protein n=1 Tax=Aliivibrio finisterrensis TaxID=511998 RepID=UPI00102172EC|nr:hypothetical protein [Aliivibrio finisterrensis]RYU64220.1 hypothetical protein ERW54_18275 [Aliivibrio finisterrensis]RYU67527.1 hypothetical protein ERW51_17775 [Aliivibrio finisterrensis]RYU70295.1 hypothetical protein ERW48_18335 [Aliivibrio finisterrensis]
MSLNIGNKASNNKIMQSALTDKDISFAQDVRRSNLAARNAETEDRRSRTRIKETVVKNIIRFIWVWFLFILSGVIIYCAEQKAIPKEVVLGLLGSSTTVLGFTGFILRGLIRDK